MTILLDPQEGQRRKALGQQLALDIDESWADRMVAEFRAWAARRVAMGLRDLRVEEFRAAAKNVPLSPNAWGSLEMGRNFVGVELKTSYYRQAVANLADALKKTEDLFSESAEAA